MRGAATFPLVLLLTIVASCGGPTGTTLDGGVVIDGWGIGPEGGCGTTDACAWGRAAAVRELDVTYPGHAPVVSVTPHEFGAVPGPDGEKVLPMFGSRNQQQLWVLALADGSQHAIHIGVPLPSDAVH